MGNCVYHVGYQGIKAWFSQIGQNVEMPTYTQAIYDARELALARMQAEAEELKADGIVGATDHGTTRTAGAATSSNTSPSAPASSPPAPTTRSPRLRSCCLCPIRNEAGMKLDSHSGSRISPNTAPRKRRQTSRSRAGSRSRSGLERALFVKALFALLVAAIAIYAVHLLAHAMQVMEQSINH